MLLKVLSDEQIRNKIHLKYKNAVKTTNKHKLEKQVTKFIILLKNCENQ